MHAQNITRNSPISPASTSPVRIALPELIAMRHRLVGVVPPPAQIADGGGNYRTRFRGRGMEFAEVRAYQNGDDVRCIDWRVTARRGQTHTKLFHEERERPVLLAIDYRRPMFFATRGCFKSVQVSRLAALLAWQALEREDRVGAFLFSEERNLELRPKRGRGAVLRLLQQMVNDPAWQRPAHRPFEPQQRLAATMQRLARVVRPGSLVLVLSDFAQWDRAVEQQLAQIGRHSELCLMHCYDPLEKELPAAGTYRVSDGLSDLTIATDREEICAGYRQRFAEHSQQLLSFSHNHRCRYVSLQTCEDPLACLPTVTRKRP
jgi:uncharacterized protein (DUF58 family)